RLLLLGRRGPGTDEDRRHRQRHQPRVQVRALHGHPPHGFTCRAKLTAVVIAACCYTRSLSNSWSRRTRSLISVTAKWLRCRRASCCPTSPFSNHTADRRSHLGGGRSGRGRHDAGESEGRPLPHRRTPTPLAREGRRCLG